MRARVDKLRTELLVLACRGGSSESFRVLVARWQEPLWRYCVRLTRDADSAWDVVQETWIAVARGMHRLEDPARFHAWLFSIARRRAADRCRRRSSEEALLEEPVCEEKIDADSQEGRVRLLRLALKELSPERRELLALHYVDELGLAEMAEVLDTPVGTIKSRLHHARRELRGVIERLERRIQ